MCKFFCGNFCILNTLEPPSLETGTFCCPQKVVTNSKTKPRTDYGPRPNGARFCKRESGFNTKIFGTPKNKKIRRSKEPRLCFIARAGFHK